MLIAVALLFLVVCSLGFLFFSKQIVIWYNRSVADIATQEEALATEYKELKKRKAALNSELMGIEQKIFLLENELAEPDETAVVAPRSRKSPAKAAAQWLLSSGKITMEQYQKATKLTGRVAQDFVETCIVLDFLDEETIAMARRIMRTGEVPKLQSKGAN